MKLVTTILVLLLSFNISAQISEEEVEIYLDNPKYQNATVTYEKVSKFKYRINVVNKNGHPIKDLTGDDFRILQNGHEAEIKTAVPMSEAQESKIKVYLCLDNSDSMVHYDEEIIQILDKLVSSFSSAADIVPIIFNESQYSKPVIIRDEPLSIKIIEGEKDEIDFSSFYKNLNLTRRTYLIDQLITAFNLANKTNFRSEDIFYVVFSDGEDIGSTFRSDEALAEYQKGKVYSIDFTQQRRDDYLEQITDFSNGKYFRSTKIENLNQSFKEVGQQIVFSGYEVTFESKMPPQLFLSGVYEFENSQFIDVSNIKIEEVRSRIVFPLLNYLFFEKNSYEIPNRYRTLNTSEVSNFSTGGLKPEQMNIYRNILNIVGERLSQNRNASITLTGCNDNTGSEKNNLSLSRKRAESVKEYLTETWGIASSRINIKSRNLPANYSNPQRSYGLEENRRVEITSDSPEILDIVEVYAISHLTEPNTLQMKYDIQSYYDIKSWELKVKQNDKVIYDEVKNTALPDKIAWNLENNLIGQRLDNSDFVISLYVTNEKGIRSTPVTKRVSIDFSSQEHNKVQRKEGKTVDKLSLVLFEFNSSKLGSRNSKVIKTVEDRINENSQILVSGYTDNSGPEKLNSKLSESRAKNTSQAFANLLNISQQRIDHKGLGETSPLYDNNLPEGRFYNRTCQIVIETSKE